MNTLCVPSETDALRRVAEWLLQATAEHGLDDDRANSLLLAVDEFATNIIRHGYGDQTGTLWLKAERCEAGLAIVLEDEAPAFDPRKVAEPDSLALPLEQRPIGGLGVYLALRSVDEFRYEFTGTRNRSTFIMHVDTHSVSARPVTTAFLTNEYPPHIYGGAGVHVEHLTRHLARLPGIAALRVLSFGNQRESDGALTVEGVEAMGDIAASDPRHRKVFDTLLRNLVMAGKLGQDLDIVHCHTWYSQFAGCLAKQLCGAKLVLTTHSLEPHRPWKVEQLGSAYHASSWIERTAYENADGIVAVSQAMKRDVQSLYGVDPAKVRVIYNGIDLDAFRPEPDPTTLRELGVDPERPYVLFVGRITRQKGIVHLVRALRYFNSGFQVVLCAGAPDTPEIGAEMRRAVDDARAQHPEPILWIEQLVNKRALVALYASASVFICPSVYEPFGIINLEAMACETPVVASAVGGIPEVVVDGETGFLVPVDVGEHGPEPSDPDRFARDLAAPVNRLMADEALRARMAAAARARVERLFGWPAIAQQTLDFYREILAR